MMETRDGPPPGVASSTGDRSGADRGGSRAMKRELRSRLQAGELEAIAMLAEETHRVLGGLITLTYDTEPLIGWRAVRALGMAAERVGRRDPDVVRRYLRRLFWLITEESGGICWFAPQGLAEIARTHEAHSDFVPIAMNLLNEMADEDLEHFRPGILWAIGRLGPLAAPHMEDVVDAVEAALEHPDPTVRGLAVWALLGVGLGDIVTRPALLEDESPVTLFEEGELRETTVAELVRRAAR